MTTWMANATRMTSPVMSDVMMRARVLTLATVTAHVPERR